MSQNYEKLFNYIKTNDCPSDLTNKIICQICQKQNSFAKKRFIFGLAIFAVSFVAFLPAIKTAIADYGSSGFGQFFSLIFTDSDIIVLSWKSFAFSLLESLPVMGLAFFLVVLLSMMCSLRLVFNFRNQITN